MNTPQDNLWPNLVALSAPAYPAGEAVPPFGFSTRVIAQLGMERRQGELMERIGLRAVFAALAVLAVTAAGAFSWDRAHRSNLEPGMNGLVQMADTPYS
jgi:hypothetical protein